MRIVLPVYNIVLDPEAKYIESPELHETIIYNPDHPDYDEPDEQESKEKFNCFMDAITSLILGHACAGIDVTTPAYLEGIETAVEACSNMC